MFIAAPTRPATGFPTPSSDIEPPKLTLPHRPASQGYVRIPRNMQDYVPDHASELKAGNSR